MIKKEFPAELKNKWFWISLIIIIISLQFFNFIGSITFKIILLFVSIFCLIYLTIVANRTKEKNKYMILFPFVFSLIVMILSTVAYIAASVGEPITAIVTLLIIFEIVILGSAFIIFDALWRAKDIHINKPVKIIITIVSYLFFAYTIIVLFAFNLSVSSGFPGNELRWNYDDNNSTLSNPYDYQYYSAAVFYSNTFGEILPFGTSRLITIIELAASSIIHIILLGIIINNLASNTQKTKAE